MKQSAAIPYRVTSGGEIEVLLVTSQTRKRWVLPKGKVPRGMPAYASAAREAREEGGVIGTTEHIPVGFYQAKKMVLGASHELRVAAYPLKVWCELEVWPEMRQRRRLWLQLHRAVEQTGDHGIKAVLRAFERRHS